MRAVHVSYAANGKNVALLSIRRGDLATSDGDETVELGGHRMSVRVQTIADGSEDVSYAWSSGGYLFNLHVNLTAGVTRSTADAMAASIQ